MTSMSDQAQRVSVSSDIFQAMVLAIEEMPAGRVRRLLNAAEADVRPVPNPEPEPDES